MAFLGLIKKKECVKTTCCCGGACTPMSNNASEDTVKQAVGGVKVLGGGCNKCNQLEKSTAEALAELGMDTTIEHITDYSVIATYGVMSTPALVVGGKVVSMGKVLTKEQVIDILQAR